FLMAQLMHLSLNVHAELRTLPDILLPIPVTSARMRERGYNQSWEMAKRISPLMGIAANPHILQHTLRIFDAQASQTQRKRKERFRALKGAFFVSEKYKDMIEGKHIILVDDVMTTGATLHHAALALKKIGAKRVDAWVFARTPEQRAQG
ncbi:MAG: ComF family protein, partial [Saezia sp.]